MVATTGEREGRGFPTLGAHSLAVDGLNIMTASAGSTGRSFLSAAATDLFIANLYVSMSQTLLTFPIECTAPNSNCIACFRLSQKNWSM